MKRSVIDVYLEKIYNEDVLNKQFYGKDLVPILSKESVKSKGKKVINELWDNDDDYLPEGNPDEHQMGYDDGYEIGYEDGKARIEKELIRPEDLLRPEEPLNEYQIGYNDGYEDGYKDGKAMVEKELLRRNI